MTGLEIYNNSSITDPCKLFYLFFVSMKQLPLSFFMDWLLCIIASVKYFKWLKITGLFRSFVTI